MEGLGAEVAVFAASLSLRRFSGAMHTDYSERVLQSTS